MFFVNDKSDKSRLEVLLSTSPLHKKGWLCNPSTSGETGCQPPGVGRSASTILSRV